MHEEKIKTRCGNSTGIADKKNLRKQTKMTKQRKNSGICRNKKEKATQEKITIQFEKINKKILVKEGILKRYRQYRQNRTFQNKERKFYRQLAWGRTYQPPYAKEAKGFWTRKWQPKNITKRLNG